MDEDVASSWSNLEVNAAPDFDPLEFIPFGGMLYVAIFECITIRNSFDDSCPSSEAIEEQNG
jgi:hypothetical protein